ncbi:hypothetical protein [Sphaerisporangium fuscum]|uniref:hypothetical protein n=1 Tax=Sphaerisporangium fuscum TaxID=2835868 RepID=UPI001BDDAAFB|nr:hypothetical protein [Sphaerisporangium fuscum]
MRYTRLGRSGLSVSRLVLGTMNFGQETSEADSHALAPTSARIPPTSDWRGCSPRTG